MNLSQIVHEYDRPGRQAELEWFRKQPTIESAIEHAALAKINDKRHRHQRRLKEVALEKAQQILLSEFKAIEQVKDFDKLYKLIEKFCKGIKGIGDLYIYDTSLRIGAKLNLKPTKVYLHAGTRVGVWNLSHYMPELDSKADTLEKSQMPREFQELETYEIEDILCISKGKFFKDKKANQNIRCC